MPIVLMEAIQYPPDNADWHAIETPHPEWSSIEPAIQRLDRDEWPFLWLHQTEPVEGDWPQHSMYIMGGRGEYGIFLSVGESEISYHDKTRSSTPIRIWESDQGSVVEESSLCNDLSITLTIARHFAETGELHPNYEWV